MSIRVLPGSVANKIAAGEVIERPASVVKELVENSIDAGATRIEVELEQAGTALIRVVDDGSGIEPEDLPLALASHATSKLSTEQDLFNVRTLGFRGEALASIAAVCDVRIVSRVPGSDAAYEVEARNGEIGPVRASGAPPGTRVEARNLFRNVPVRKKFLRSAATEMAHITEAVTRLALAHHRIHFALSHGGRKIFSLAAAPDRAQRIGEFFGREIADNMIPFRHRASGIEIEGYLLPPAIDRLNARMQYTYVNGRYVRDTTLLHGIAEAYGNLMARGRKPVCFLFITTDPADVDVNVHPTKLEVRFRRARQVHAELVASMKQALRDAKLTPQVSLHEQDGGAPGETRESVRQAIADFFARVPAGEHVPGGVSRVGGKSMPTGAGPARRAAPHGAPSPGVAAPPAPPRFGNCFQVLDCYIVEEVEDGINIIDQHALHERILYNEMRRRLENGPLDSQQLLVPELVELPQQEFYALVGLSEELARFGVRVEPFGERTIIVRSYPSVFDRFDARGFFRDLLDEMEGSASDAPVGSELEALMKVTACRAAVKAGQRLSAEQIRWLLERRSESGPTDTCPHGRPTTVRITSKELEKQFHRT